MTGTDLKGNQMSDNIFVGMPEIDWALVVKVIDHRLYDMDQENHFFSEEPSKEYYHLIEIRDYILGFTNLESDVQ